ncbi:MAG: SHOCT domain-containing protein [Alphaproteobacteria bacterium]
MRKKLSLIPGVVTVFVAQPLLAIAQTTARPDTSQVPPGYGHWHMWGDHPGYHFWWIPLMMFLFLVICFVAMRYFWPGRHGGRMHWHSRDASASAIEILNERFAKGEIEEKEYDEKKAKILSG